MTVVLERIEAKLISIIDAGEFRMMFIENRMELGPVCASAMESPQ